jgi:hypothetical protein
MMEWNNIIIWIRSSPNIIPNDFLLYTWTSIHQYCCTKSDNVTEVQACDSPGQRTIKTHTVRAYNNNNSIPTAQGPITTTINSLFIEVLSSTASGQLQSQHKYKQ